MPGVSGGGTVDVIADVMGWYAKPSPEPGDALGRASPTRILDTRNGAGLTGGSFAPQEHRNLTVGGSTACPSTPTRWS